MILSIVALVASLVSLVMSGLALRKQEPRTEALERVCAIAVGYAEKVGGSSNEKRRHAIEAARALDMKDGKRDFSDVELRVGVEAALAGR